MSECKIYDPDKVFRNFQLVEFPISFVGLSTTKELNVETDLNGGSTYLRTLCDGSIMDFEDARKTSPSHRSYSLNLQNYHKIEITFTPTNECLAKVKLQNQKEIGNRFVVDLRVINVEGKICCNDESHAEVGRYYISGQYECCNVSHSPKVVDFGNVAMKSKVIKTICIRNDSKQISAQVHYHKVMGFDVTPRKFCIPPNSSKKISIALNPQSLKVGNILYFHIKNPHDTVTEPKKFGEDSNFLPYAVCVQANIFIGSPKKIPHVESLHTIFECDPKNTYLRKEIATRYERNMLANQFLQFAKSTHKKKILLEKFSSPQPGCYSESLQIENIDRRKSGHFFCHEFHPEISAQDLFNVVINPLTLHFGKVAYKTFGEQDFTVKNNSEYDIMIKFKHDHNIVYTVEKLSEYTIKLERHKEITIKILCYGLFLGAHENTFELVIDKKFNREYVYKIQVENPVLTIPTTVLKFGMATSESFITSVPVKIFNYFNIAIDYEWEVLNAEVPFEILPNHGTVPAHGCKINEITYISKCTKTKSYDINFFSKGTIAMTIAIEANIISRKVTLKFLRQQVVYKDVPLNMDVTEHVKLENSSRENALFYVVEPLFPGMTIIPMNGMMRPKSIITLQITIKISCIIEFSYDLFVRVNNKETIGLPISGNIMEPKLTMSPRIVFMPRVPCGLITYIPVTIQNFGNVPTLMEILDTGDENIFDVYVQEGYDKHKIHKFIIKAGQSKALFVKVYDVFRREYDIFIPIKVNGLLGPPNRNQSSSTEIGYYVGEYEKLYENNPKVKVKSIHRDINYLRINGVFTVPWIEFSTENFYIVYTPNGYNRIPFTMTNVSKYYLYVCIQTSKLYPHFSLDVETEDSESIINDTCIKFNLERGKTASLWVIFHPYGLGKVSATAVFYLDKAMSLPYYNLLFTGNREYPDMTASTNRIVFPPVQVGTSLSKTITVTLAAKSELDAFSCSSKEESNITVELINCTVVDVEDTYNTIITVMITVLCKTTYSRNLSLVFHHDCGSTCCVEVCFCYTYCPITLHVSRLAPTENNSYPFYPLSAQTELYEYMEQSVYFLERWIFFQGFRRDLFPIIPDTFHALGPNMVNTIKIKGINLTFLNFMKRIAGPLIKHIHKASCTLGEPIKTVINIHDTYKSVINLLRSRGANLWLLQAKFLLTHEQFKAYSEFKPPAYEADVAFTQNLVQDSSLFLRLSKQSWMDLILQCYKVFILDSCFFECVCVSIEPRNIEKVLIDWYNEQLIVAHYKILKDRPIKKITNLTTDLKDGIAIISALYNHCPFLEGHSCSVCEVDENDPLGGIIHNACIIMENMNYLKLLFPLTSKDFLKPNYLQMFFLSVHLYVILPMFRPKGHIEFRPPLLRASSRTISINPMGQEGLSFNFSILNSNKNCFSVEKNPLENNSKKTSIIVKYRANFVTQDRAILMAYGYNKTRIFDTYVIFFLIGNIGALNPFRKCKLTAPIYRPNKVDITVHSPFLTDANYKIYVTDKEPNIPMNFENVPKKGFYFKRLSLIDSEIMLPGTPVEPSIDILEHKVYLFLYCLNTHSESSYIWFRSEIGEFFIKVATQPRWDLAIETYSQKVRNWPIDPCSCGEACECYRSFIIKIPHRNDLMLKALRSAMADHTSNIMMNIYDNLIETTMGREILKMLLNEGGTNMTEISHVLRQKNSYRIISRGLIPHKEHVTLHQYSGAVLTLPLTIPPAEKSDKLTITLASDCGMDIRSYKVIFEKDEVSCGRYTDSTSFSV